VIVAALVLSSLLCVVFPAAGDGPGSGEDHGLGADPGIVAVAASLYPCVQELAGRYAASGRTPPRLVVGASGKLARQIEAGAPFGLFLSANLEWLEYLANRGLAGSPQPLAASRLVLWWPEVSAPEPGLLDGKLRVALADPEAAPFGAAARRYLQERGAYAALGSARRLIITGTVLQAALAVRGGGADLAFTALSVAHKLGGSYCTLPVPALQHGGTAVPGRMTEPLDEFWRYIRSSEAEAVWRTWGFEPARAEGRTQGRTKSAAESGGAAGAP
jgi:molybdate transport system substrate-binding protein